MATTTPRTETSATMETRSRSRTVRSLRGGQMTIPIEFRRELGIDEDTMLQVTLEDGALRVVPVQIKQDLSEPNPLRDLYEYFAPVREAILASGMTQEELWAEIDAAIAEVRAEKREKLKQRA